MIAPIEILKDSGNRAPPFSLKSLKATNNTTAYPSLSQKHLSGAARGLGSTPIIIVVIVLVL